jgi:hypothetical protein
MFVEATYVLSKTKCADIDVQTDTGTQKITFKALSLINSHEQTTNLKKKIPYRQQA